MCAWFSVNGRSLSIEKTHIVKFSSESPKWSVPNYLPNKTMKEATNVNFLGLELDKYMN